MQSSMASGHSSSLSHARVWRLALRLSNEAAKGFRPMAAVDLLEGGSLEGKGGRSEGQV